MDAQDLSGQAAMLAATIRELELSLRGAQPDQSSAALSALGDLCREHGFRAAAAVPILLEHLAWPGDTVTYALSYALDDLEPIVQRLSDSSALIRQRAAEVLGLMGERANVASDDLRSLLADPDPQVRSKAAWAIGLMRDSRRVAVERLLELVESSVETDRSAALHALGNVGRAHDGSTVLRAHQELLIRALQDPNEEARRWALYALEAADLEPDRHTRLLIARLEEDSSHEVRQAVLEDLERLVKDGADASHATPLLVRLMDADPGRALRAIRVLQALGPVASAALPNLASLARRQEENPLVALGALRAMQSIGGDMRPMLPLLESLLGTDPEPTCDLVYELGSTAAPLLSGVIKALQSEDWDTQWAAADALGAIASADPECLDALESALGYESPIVRAAVRKAFVRIGPAAVPRLVQILRSTDSSRAEWAADALGCIGPSARPATPTLQERLDRKHDAVATWSTIALALIEGRPELVPSLLAIVRSTDGAYQKAQAIRGLQMIGPPANSGLHCLRELLDNEDDEIRDAALAAIASIQGRLQ
jgi:HEAT repeat protein